MEINTFTKVFENELSFLDNLTIGFPNLGSIKVLDSLKTIKRTGKLIRFAKYDKNIPVRSIYDHINTLANNYSVFIRFEDISYSPQKIAVMICYHDLCESIIGDFPFYTKFISNVQYLNNILEIDKDTRERYANNLLYLFANEKQRNNFDYLNETDKEHEFFTFLDRTDPIINIWRYMYTFNSDIKPNKEYFIECMIDFFNNPVLQTFIKENKHPVLCNLLKLLTNKENALAFIDNTDVFSDNLLFEELIKKVSLFA